MPFERPSLNTLQQRSLSDFQARLPGSAPVLRRRLLGNLLAAISGAVHGLYGWLAERARQDVPYTATGEDLVRWAGIWGVVKKQPTYAVGSVTLTGAPGKVIEADARLQTSSGIEFSIEDEVTIDGDGEAVASVAAVEPGKAANVASGAVLSFISPPEGVDGEAVATDGLSGGADLESDDSLRARMLREIQDPPQGGSKADYERWALQVGPITRAWCFPTYRGPGSVRVYVVNDDHVGADLAGAGDVAAAFDHIDSVKPVGVVIEDPENPGEYINGLEVLAPTKKPVNFVIDETPDDLAVRAAMEAAIKDLFRREAVPEGGIAYNKIIVALGAATGAQTFTVSAPVAAPTADEGELLVPGTFTF